MNRYFVFFASGDEHVERMNTAIKTYRRFSSAKIICVTSNANVQATGDKNVTATFKNESDGTTICKLGKTRIHEYVGLEDDAIYCYCDNDTFAVSPRIDEIFDFKNGPITFASDSGKTVKSFSRYAVRKGSLSDAIKRTFGIDVKPEWDIWNGGVFLFDKSSVEFMNLWAAYTTVVVAHPEWTVRDQGTLIVTAWKMGLQDAIRIPSEWNWLHKLKRGIKIKPEGFFHSNDVQVHLMHFPVSYGKGNCFQKIMTEYVNGGEHAS